MQTSEEFEPVFLAAQLCRTSGNSAQCIEAIQNVARNMANARGTRNEDPGNKVRFGYDLDSIDTSFTSGIGNGTHGYEDDGDNLGDEYIPPPQFAKGKDEEPSLHRNRSKFMIPGSALGRPKQWKPSENPDDFAVGNVAVSTPKPIEMPKQLMTQQQVVPLPQPQQPVPLPQLQPHLVPCYTFHKNAEGTGCFLLVLGLLIPLLFVCVLVWMQYNRSEDAPAF